MVAVRVVLLTFRHECFSFVSSVHASRDFLLTLGLWRRTQRRQTLGSSITSTMSAASKARPWSSDSTMMARAERGQPAELLRDVFHQLC